MYWNDKWFWLHVSLLSSCTFIELVYCWVWFARSLLIVFISPTVGSFLDSRWAISKQSSQNNALHLAQLERIFWMWLEHCGVLSFDRYSKTAFSFSNCFRIYWMFHIFFSRIIVILYQKYDGYNKMSSVILYIYKMNQSSVGAGVPWTVQNRNGSFLSSAAYQTSPRDFNTHHHVIPGASITPKPAGVYFTTLFN